MFHVSVGTTRLSCLGGWQFWLHFWKPFYEPSLALSFPVHPVPVRPSAGKERLSILTNALGTRIESSRATGTEWTTGVRLPWDTIGGGGHAPGSWSMPCTCFTHDDSALREVAFLSVELALRCWVSVLEVLFFARGTEKLWLFCSSVIWSYRSLGKRSQVMVEYVELGTKPSASSDATGWDSASSSPPSQGCCRKRFYIRIPFPGCDRDSTSSNPSRGCYRTGFCTQHPFSRMLQEGILCLALPLEDTAGRKDFPSLVWNLDSSYEMHMISCGVSRSNALLIAQTLWTCLRT